MIKSIQYISDLHLERRNVIPKLKVLSKNLVLLGDIGNPYEKKYVDFLYYVSYNYERVFLLSGNHEYWHGNYFTIKENYFSINEKIKKIISPLSNIEFLNNSSSRLYDYRILGTVLWVPKYITLYEESIFWLEKTLEKKEKTLVFSHYLPSFKLIDEKYKNYNLKDHYASPLDFLLQDPIKLWLCGHSHSTLTLSINNIPCAINAVGHEKIINRVVFLT